MSRPTWEPVKASLHIVGEEEPLLQQTSNRNMVYLNSHSTKTEAEVVWIQDMAELRAEKVRGKIVFGEMSGRRLFNTAVKEMGALGIITYDMPGYLQPEKNTSSIQFRSLAYDRKLKPWGIALSFEAKERLKGRLGIWNGTGVKVDIETKMYILRGIDGRR
jgi:aminopeptidase YwaD